MCLFLIYLAVSAPDIAEKGAALVEKALGRVWKGFRKGSGIQNFGNAGLGKAANFGNAGFWRLKAPKTRISGA